MNKIKEIRNGVGMVKRTIPESRHVEGYAAVFNEWSQDLGGFREKIDPKAFESVIERSDVFALLDHDRSRGILARCKYGDEISLRLSVDDHGLRYEFDAPETELGNQLLACLTRGEIDASSFAFTVLDDVWTRNGDIYERTITQIDELFDVSPVYSPAYTQTECDLRGLDALKAEERAAEERRKAEEEKVALGKYIADLKAEINPNLNDNE